MCGLQGSNGVRLPCAVTVHAPPPPPLAGEGDDDEEDRAVTAARRREGGKVQLVEEARYLEELAVEVPHPRATECLRVGCLVYG